jgi:protein-disulfide isomerase/uncharacterized membrane protein
MTQPKTTPLAIFTGITFLTVLDHLYLAWQHYSLKMGLGSGSGLCNINEKFSCDAVALSSYAKIFDVPVALWAAATHIAILIFTIAIWMNRRESIKMQRFAFLMTAFVLLMTFIMGPISFFIIKKYCLFCTFAYFLSFIQFGLAYKIFPHDFKKLGSDIKSLFTDSRPTAFIFLFIPAAAFLANSMILDSLGFGKAELFMEENAQSWQASPVIDFNQNSGLIHQNGEPVKMTIVEFADYLCPHCKHAAPAIKAFANSHPGTKIIFKVFPLDGTCNSALTRKGDGLRCQLSYMSFCAEKIAHKGWETHYWIFENQEELSLASFPEDVRKVSAEFQIPLADFQKCINSDDDIRALVSSQANEGVKANVPGTPTIFVNGKKLDNGQFLPLLDKVYSEL